MVLRCGWQPLGASWRSSVATGWLAAVGFHTGRILLNDSKKILLWGVGGRVNYEEYSGWLFRPMEDADLLAEEISGERFEQEKYF